jgi:hypothetical protein
MSQLSAIAAPHLHVVYYESLKRELKTVGAMKDYKQELRNLHASHALGWSREGLGALNSVCPRHRVSSKLGTTSRGFLVLLRSQSTCGAKASVIRTTRGHVSSACSMHLMDGCWE